ncbi:DUF2024 family protein [Alcaligenes sp. Marseille-Q7550]
MHDQDDAKALDVVLDHGRRYLSAKGVPADTLNARECRFCHTEIASTPVENEIKRIGFAIIELEHCD